MMPVVQPCRPVDLRPPRQRFAMTVSVAALAVVMAAPA